MNCINERKETPIELAYRCNRPVIVKLLIIAGYEFERQNQEHESLEMWVAIQDGEITLAKIQESIITSLRESHLHEDLCSMIVSFLNPYHAKT